MNKYYEISKDFDDKILCSINEILKVYGNELSLKIEELNLLNDDNNCIESSTAIGFCIEEFIVNKLMKYTHNCDDSWIKIKRLDKQKTQNSSYDCYSRYMDHYFMINIKVDRGSNNAIASINQLYKDYVMTNIETTKHYLVLKLLYKVNKSINDNDKKIIINSVQSYFLEEIDFSNGHKQDNRNWSKNYNKNSGGLQISNKFREENKKKEENINYESTVEAIKKIFSLN